MHALPLSQGIVRPDGSYYFKQAYTVIVAGYPLAVKYLSFAPYAYCGGNPIRYSDYEGLGWWDKAIGFITGIVTNIIPGSSPLRDVYSPSDAADYNSGLLQADIATMKAAQVGGRTGTGAMATGVTIAASGAVAVTTVGGAPVGAGIGGVGATVATAGVEIASAGMLLVWELIMSF